MGDMTDREIQIGASYPEVGMGHAKWRRRKSEINRFFNRQKEFFSLLYKRFNAQTNIRLIPNSGCENPNSLKMNLTLKPS